MRSFCPAAGAVVIWFSLLFGPLHDAQAQTTPVDPQTAAQLQVALDDLRTNHSLKGLSASVFLPGKGTWQGVSGISHANVPIDTTMVFAMGYITQNITAAAILLLQQDSLLSLSDQLHQYLPRYPNIDPTITIKQLLQHTSGIYNYFAHPDCFTAINSNPAQIITPQYVLNNYVNTPYFAPGTSYQYSTTNYLLLGLIIEEVTGQSYTSFIRQRLLGPLQLNSLYLAEQEPATGVIPHHWSSASAIGPGTDLSSIPLTALLATSPAAAALFGNPYDLARWGRLLFTGQVLQDSSLQLMKQFLPINGTGLETGYSMGLMRYATGTAQAWGHTGVMKGFASGLLFSPADSIVVSISSNQPWNGNNLAWELLGTARQQLLSAAPDAAGLPDALVCFPNPAQGKGHIRYTLRQAQPVEITLQNSLGQTVQTLLREPQPAGEHSLTVDTSTLPTGLYFCTLQTAGSRLVQRWVVTQ